MKTIESIIEEWKAVRIPISVSEEKEFFFEKDCNYKEDKKEKGLITISVVIRDRFTRVDKKPHGKSFVDVFTARYQNQDDAELKAQEVMEFEVFLKKFTKASVEARRKEILEYEDTGCFVDYVDF